MFREASDRAAIFEKEENSNGNLSTLPSMNAISSEFFALGMRRWGTKQRATQMTEVAAVLMRLMKRKSSQMTTILSQ